MSSLVSQMLASYASPVNQQVAGEVVTRCITGDENNTEDITAIVSLGEQTETNDRGPGFLTRGKIQVADDQEVTKEDGWLLRDTRYETEAIDPPFGGLIVLHVIRRDATRTTSDRRSHYGR